jgi:arylsulfatase A-like enzyme
MNGGSFMKYFLAATVLITGFAVQAAEPETPNVVLMFIDDLGYGDTAPFGCKDIPTPHLDRLAAEGVAVTQSYITNPPCCPSRCTLMMGMYGGRFGKYGMSRGLPIPDDKPTLAEFMRDNGYVTGQIGKWDVGTKAQGPSARGFMEVAVQPRKKDSKSKYFCVREDGTVAWLTDVDGDRIVEFVERHKDEPFFLYWSPHAVHSSNKEAPPRLTDRTTANAHRKPLAGAICSVDDQVGKLLAALEKHKLREKTLVIFSSDNGANVGEGGTSTPYRGGKGSGTQQVGWTIIPTIISWPGTVQQGKRYDGLSCTLDFYTTMAAAIGKPAPKHLDGVNLLPYLKGEKTDDAHEYLFWLNNEPGDAERRHLIAVRWKNWRLYRKYKDDPWQLFDLVKDPREEKDVAAQHPDVVANMSKRHAEWAKTLAPLGKIPNVPKPLPPTARDGWIISDGNLRPKIDPAEPKAPKEPGRRKNRNRKK